MLSQQTLDEQRAGREAVEKSQRDAVAFGGLLKLRERFGNKTIVTASWALGTADQGHVVHVMVACADGKILNFKDKLWEFPSELTIAQIALVT